MILRVTVGGGNSAERYIFPPISIAQRRFWVQFRGCYLLNNPPWRRFLGTVPPNFAPISGLMMRRTRRGAVNPVSPTYVLHS